MSGLIYETDIPCECGEKRLKIVKSFMGFMGSIPCSEYYGECCNCKKTIYNSEIDKRFLNKA